MIWYEEEVKRLEKEIASLTYHPEIVFYGSSSIRMWTTLTRDLQDFNPVNLGFGGSTLAACVWFFGRIMGKLPAPQALVLYAGDNDLGDGRNPEEVYIYFQQFAAQVSRHYHNMPCFYISLKPSISRWPLVDKFRYANQLISRSIAEEHSNWQYINIFDKMLSAEGKPSKENYSEDGLHMNARGYKIWTEVIKEHLSAIIKTS